MASRRRPREDDSDDDGYTFGRNKRYKTGVSGGAFRRPLPEDEEADLNRDFYAYYEQKKQKAKQSQAARESVLPQEDSLRNVIHSLGPGRRVMQQAMIVSTVMIDKDEATKRFRCNHDTFAVPNSLKAGMEEVFRVTPGEVLFERCGTPQSLNRAQLGTFGTRIVFSAMNGLQRDELVRWAGVLAQPESDPQKRTGDNAHTNEEHGSTTITLNGPLPIEPGQGVLADEMPYFRVGADGVPESIIRVTGLPPTKLLASIWPLRYNSIEQALAEARSVVDDAVKEHKNKSALIRDVNDRFNDARARFGRVNCLHGYALYYLAVRVPLLFAEDEMAAQLLEQMHKDIDEDVYASAHTGAFGSVAGTPDYELFKKALVKVQANLDAPSDIARREAGITAAGDIAEILERRKQASQERYRNDVQRRLMGICIKGGRPGAAINLALRASNVI